MEGENEGSVRALTHTLSGSTKSMYMEQKGRASVSGPSPRWPLVSSPREVQKDARKEEKKEKSSIGAEIAPWVLSDR